MKTKLQKHKNIFSNLTKVFVIGILMIIGLTAKAQISCVANFTYTTSGNQVIFTNTSTGVNSNTIYNWSFYSPTQTSNLANPTFTVASSGVYYAYLIIYDSLNFCQSSKVDTLLITISGINDQPSLISSLNCYPSPITDNATISYYIQKDAPVELSLIDILGKKVMTIEKEEKTSGKHSISWSSENVSQGIYFVQLKVNNQVSTKKVVITK